MRMRIAAGLLALLAGAAAAEAQAGAHNPDWKKCRACAPALGRALAYVKANLKSDAPKRVIGSKMGGYMMGGFALMMEGASPKELEDCVRYACQAIKDEGFNRTRVQGIGSGERVLKTTERPAHLAKNRLNLPDELFAHVDPADEMVGHADVVEPRENILADAVVDHALALDRALLLRVEGGGVVLEILDDGAGLGAFIEDLGLAFVDLAATGHIFSLHSSRGPGKRGYKRGARCVLVRAPHPTPVPHQARPIFLDFAVQGALHSKRWSAAKLLPRAS